MPGCTRLCWLLCQGAWYLWVHPWSDTAMSDAVLFFCQHWTWVFFSIAPQLWVSIQLESYLPVGSSAGLLHATAQVPAKQLAPGTSATGLTSQQLHCFTPMGDLGQGDYGNVQVCWCRACQPDLLLLPQPAEQQHRSTGAGETCTVRSFFIILPCQSGTSKGQYFLFPFKENTMTVLQTGWLF